MPAMTTDPAQLRAAAEAQLDRLRGPMWASDEDGEAADWMVEADDGPGLAEPPARRVAAARVADKPTRARRSAPTKPSPKRRPGRPAFETPRLAARELRIPVVVDERAREVAAWGGIEPTEAIWLLVTLGWESWATRRAAGATP